MDGDYIPFYDATNLVAKKSLWSTLKSALKTYFDDLYDSTPVGTVLSFMGKTAPTGYLICDGTVYNISDYPNLANFFLIQSLALKIILVGTVVQHLLYQI